MNTPKKILNISDLKDWWSEYGHDYIIPKSKKVWPEGWNVVEYIKDIIIERNWQYKSICDVGCGYGRLVSAFDPRNYIGVDLNPNILKRVPKEYKTKEISKVNDIPKADIYFLYTVFNHTPEELAYEMIKHFYNQNAEWVLVCEILGRVWKNDKLKHPSYGKEISEYIELFNVNGFELIDIKAKLYVSYKNWNMSFLFFRRK